MSELPAATRALLVGLAFGAAAAVLIVAGLAATGALVDRRLRR